MSQSPAGGFSVPSSDPPLSAHVTYCQGRLECVQAEYRFWTRFDLVTRSVVAVGLLAMVYQAFWHMGGDVAMLGPGCVTILMLTALAAVVSLLADPVTRVRVSGQRIQEYVMLRNRLEALGRGIRDGRAPQSLEEELSLVVGRLYEVEQ